MNMKAWEVVLFCCASQIHRRPLCVLSSSLIGTASSSPSVGPFVHKLGGGDDHSARRERERERERAAAAANGPLPRPSMSREGAQGARGRFPTGPCNGHAFVISADLTSFVPDLRESGRRHRC